jgi:type IV pilus assembly protein PilN
MIRINLLPVKQAAQAGGNGREMRERASRWLCSSRSRALFGCSKAGAGGRGRIGQLETALRALDSQVRDVNDLEAKKALDSKLKVIADLGRKRVGPVGVMSDLSKATPDRVWLTDFSEAGGSATITGQAIDNQIVASSCGTCRRLLTSRPSTWWRPRRTRP